MDWTGGCRAEGGEQVSRGWGWRAEESVSYRGTCSSVFVNCRFHCAQCSVPGNGVALMRGPGNPIAGGLARAVPNTHPPGLSRPGPQGLPLAPGGIRLKVETWTMDFPNPRELGFSSHTRDSGVGPGCRCLTTVEFPGPSLSSDLELKTSLNRIGWIYGW